MTPISIQEQRTGAGRNPAGPAFLSAGFRPFFLLASLWAAVAVPVWLAAYVHGYSPAGALPAMLWHAHEMVFGFGLAAVAGFLLTAIPNWTGRLPVSGLRLGALAALWLAGRVALLASRDIGATAAAAIDLAFPAALTAVIARELIAGGNLRNMPMLGALGLLFTGNALVHLHALDLAYTAQLGVRIGIATLLALIALVGGRIIPSFTHNWLAKNAPDARRPAAIGRLDLICLVTIVCGLAAWAASPQSRVTAALLVAAGFAAAARLSRWRGLATLRDPLLFVLHLGYGWLAFGLALLGLDGLLGWAAPGAALHALTVGAIGTMTLAVMTRATLGHTGRALAAGPATIAIYALVTIAAVLRIVAPLADSHAVMIVSIAGVAWMAAFGAFSIHYGSMLLKPRR